MTADTPEALAETFAAKMSAGDVDGAMALWTEEATIVTAEGQLIQGRAAVGGALRALIDNGARLDLHVARVFTAGAVALVQGTLTVSGEDGSGGRYSHTSNSTVIYTRADDGQWRVALDAPWGLPPV